MRFKVTYRAGGKDFSNTCDNIAEAYEYARALVLHGQYCISPQEQALLSDLMIDLVGMDKGYCEKIDYLYTDEFFITKEEEQQ